MIKKLLTLRDVPFVRDVATLQIGRFLSVGCGFLSSILYARYLGLDGFGKYAVIMAFAGVFSIFTNLGQQAALTTFLAESYGKKNTQETRRICRYYVAISCLAALLLVIFAVISPVISIWIYQDATIGKLAALVFLSSLFEFPFSYVAIVLQVTREIRMLTFLENAKIVTQLGASVLLLVTGYGVTGILVGSIIGSVVFAVISLLIYPSIQQKYSLPSWKEVCQLSLNKQTWQYWKNGFWIAMDKNIGNLYPTIFLFMLSMTATEAVVGLVRLAFKLANLPSSFSLSSINRLSSSVLPTLSGKGADILKNAIKKLIIHSVGIHSLLTIGAMICVPIFLPYVYGENFKVATYPFLVIVTLQLLAAVHSFATPVLRMKSKIYIASLFNAGSMLASLLTFLALQNVLTKTTWALYGAIIVYHVAVSFVALPAWRYIQPTNKTL